MKNNKWYWQGGADGDVVISTRIRLARNSDQFPFPSSMNAEQRQQVLDLFRSALQEVPESVGPLTWYGMPALSALEAQSMVERHLISPEFAKREEGGALLASADESVSLMLNEEDHLRIQVMRAGLALDEAYAVADELDTRLDEAIAFAFDDRLGYLTQCPTNLGTGMRASLMLHLPALQERGAIQQLANTVSKLGLTIRGLYGEGSKSEGAIYQLSNQVTLGISEDTAIENLKGIAAQIIRQERTARDILRQNPYFEDRVWRSLGLMQTARLMAHDEFMTLISNVRVGVAVGVIDGLSLDVLGELLVTMQPATLLLGTDKELDPIGRDSLRARLVREKLQVAPPHT